MHVAVESLQLRHDHRGVGRYVRRLLSAMAAQRPDIRYTLSARNVADTEAVRQQLAELPLVAERTDVVPVGRWSETACDVAWYPWNFVRTRTASGAVVPTIHDLAPMHQLDGRWWKVLKRRRARRAYLHAVAVADHVITGASRARDELVALLGADPARISVVPHAADAFRTVSPSPADAVLERIDVRGPFLLAVGSQEARKNLPVLFEAMALLTANGHDLPLVLCGSNARRIAGYGNTLPPWLHWAGFVRDDELAGLYARSLALVFPSRYEGFGLPVLEAMTAGGIVVCSNASTLPEVGGEAALYFPPNDAAALAAQVERLVNEPALRDALRERGRLQAAQYSWSGSARGTLAALDAGISTHRARAQAR